MCAQLGWTAASPQSAKAQILPHRIPLLPCTVIGRNDEEFKIVHVIKLVHGSWLTDLQQMIAFTIMVIIPFFVSSLPLNSFIDMPYQYVPYKSLKVYNSAVFRIFLELCINHHSQFENIFMTL